MALLHIPFGSACRNDVFEERRFSNFNRVLVIPWDTAEPRWDAPMAQWASPLADSRISVRRSGSGDA